MNTRIFSVLFALCVTLTASAKVTTPLELWTYTNVSDGTLLSSVPSETGTGSAFGTGASFLTVQNERMQIKKGDYAEGLTNAAYSGRTAGVYQISYEVKSAAFMPPVPATSGRFGWGLRSSVGGASDCKTYFQFKAGKFEVIAQDQSGEHTDEIETRRILSTPVTIRQVYFLNDKGTPGSFKVYWSTNGGAEQEILPGQLTLPANFQLDEFRMEVNDTASGFNWLSSNVATVDNLSFIEIAANPELTFLQEDVSMLQKNGIFDNNTYEPGDVLQIITTNQNTGFASAHDVETSLYADPTAFNITTLSSNAYPSIGMGQLYTGTFQVKILDGATNGSHTFTVTNRINSSSAAAALAFPAEFGEE